MVSLGQDLSALSISYPCDLLIRDSVTSMGYVTFHVALHVALQLLPNGECFTKCILLCQIGSYTVLYMFQGHDIKEKWLISDVICQPGGHCDQAYINLSLVTFGKHPLLSLCMSVLIIFLISS